MISLALQNLISNVIKYHGEKPPKIQIQFTYQYKITVIVTVQDNGIGIEESSKNSIFDMFSRLHSKSKIPGSGLGLAIVRRVVKRHHGQTGVESRVGEGSTFWFTLPQNEYITEQI